MVSDNVLQETLEAMAEILREYYDDGACQNLTDTIVNLKRHPHPQKGAIIAIEVGFHHESRLRRR
jgi:hypothetical protein